MAVYDLEERTFQFGRECGLFVRNLPRSILNYEYGKQLVRSSASIGANYIEATESLGKKDFQMRLRICIKEAKESAFWLRMIEETALCDDIDNISHLVKESIELRKILYTILTKHKSINQ